MAHVTEQLCKYEMRRLEKVEKSIEPKKTLGKILYCMINKSHKDCIIGLDVKSQKKSRVRKRRKRQYSNSSSDSGDEWTPALETCVTKKKTNSMRGNNIYIKYGFNSLCLFQ